MKSYALTQVPNHVLLRDLDSLVAKDRLNTADLLAHLGEVEARRLYAPASCSSMHVYCLRVLRLSEDAAIKRLRVARMARRVPAIFPAIADGRLTLTAVLMLRPYLVQANAGALLALAEHKTNAELAEALAAVFPRSDVPTSLEPLGLTSETPRPGRADTMAVGVAAMSLATGGVTTRQEVECTELVAARPPVEATELSPAALAASPVAPRTEPAPAPAGAAPSAPSCTSAPPDRARLAPLSAERYALQVTISRTTRDKIRRAQDLLGHSIRPGDVAEVIDRALDLLVARLEARKRGLTDRPHTESPRPSKNARYVSRADRRFIEQRDGGQCTYVGPDDRRCEERFALQLHHDEAFARGGPTTRDNLFLRCPTHNQLAAEREFGAEHVHRKRDERRARVARERAEGQARGARRASEASPVESKAAAEAARSAAEAAAAKARRDFDALLGEAGGTPTPCVPPAVGARSGSPAPCCLRGRSRPPAA